MRKMIVFCGLILVLAFIFRWQLADLRTSEPNISSNPTQAQKTIAPEPAQKPPRSNKQQENLARDEDKSPEESAHDGPDIFGIVRDQAGSPIRGAEVKAFQGDGHRSSGEIITTTLADGSYSLSGLHYPSNSPYQVVASAQGYAPASSGLFLFSHPPKMINLTLTNGASLSGTVVDESHAAISGATVELLQGARHDPMSEIDKKETDADGAYAFRHISPGEYWFHVSAKGYINQERKVAIASHGTQPAQDFMLEYAGDGYCSGVVLDENDQPLEGVKVRGFQNYVGALLTGYLSHTCNSTADGNFLLEGFIQRGSDGSNLPIKLRATKEGYRASSTTVFSGDRSALIRLQKDYKGSISGQVVEATKGDSLKPVTEFQVEVLRCQSTLFAFRHFQSGAGEFLFSDIAEGTYDLRISAPNRAPHFKEWVAVKSGEETSVGSIRLTRGATVTGKVRGKGELEPLAGAMVYINAGEVTKRLQILTGTSTDETGFYRLEGVPSGPNYVLASHPAYATAVSPIIEVDEGKEYSNIDLLLGNGGAIEGRVTDGGIPLAWHIISLSPSADTDSTGRRKSIGPLTYAQADENGYYHKDGLMQGSYVCVAVIPDRRADVTGGLNTIYDTVEIVEGETTRFDIDLCAGRGSVKGTVTSEAPVPAGATEVDIRLYRNKAAGANTTITDARVTSTSVGSSFSFDDVCPGEYTIGVSLRYDIPGGVRTQGVPCRLNPPGTLVVQAGGITQRDVILMTYE